MRKFITLVTLLLALAVWVVRPDRPWAAGDGPPANAPTGRVPAGNRVITVEEAAIGATTTLGGTVVPYREVSFSAQMPGRVEYIAGVEGDWFKKGVVLVALDEDDLLAKHKSAQAALATASANWRNARVQYTRQVYSGSSMASDNMGMDMPRMFDRVLTRPMSDMVGLDNPELTRRAQIYAQGTQIDQARYSLAQAQAALQELEAKLRDTRSIAPFAGVIVAKHIEVGDTVQPGMPLVSFADTRHLQIKVDVPARLMPGIKKGMLISARLDVGGVEAEAEVAQVFPMADPQRHTVTVKLDLAKGSPGGPGMYAEVMVPDITTPVRNLPTIPKTSVIWRGSLPAVLVATEGKEPELRMIRLGGFVEMDSVSVLSGLQVGEKIYAEPPAGMVGGWDPQGKTEEKTVPSF
ncbi:MAG: efflux transporter, RND family, MFP subunit [Magnetococcales bacterium]|nr:efflux transporter, RND family, MFP subunit [Magnetococcales bacterium]HIJ82676.1 HlyD family efflux transporter periplasmic adaptor subunit [Magnetococcales bacterium]